jgi:uncharacterized protein YjbI with pentapeptide repeats
MHCFSLRSSLDSPRSAMRKLGLRIAAVRARHFSDSPSDNVNDEHPITRQMLHQYQQYELTGRVSAELKSTIQGILRDNTVPGAVLMSGKDIRDMLDNRLQETEILLGDRKLERMNFQGVTFTKVKGESVSFSRSVFVDATFEHCHFLSCDFDGCDFSRAIFRNCKFERCSFVFCQLQLVDMSKQCEFVECDFDLADMSGIHTRSDVAVNAEGAVVFGTVFLRSRNWKTALKRHWKTS